MRKEMLVVVLATIAAPLTGPCASAQTPTQAAAQQNKPAPKKPKVWTDDNIGAVRSPSDVYSDDEDAQQATQATAKKAAGQEAEPQSNSIPPPAEFNPKTVQDADGMIAKQQNDISTEQAYVAELKNEINDPSTPDSEKQRLEGRMKTRSANVQQLQSNLAELQKEKAALEKKAAAAAAAGGNSASGGSGSSQN